MYNINHKLNNNLEKLRSVALNKGENGQNGNRHYTIISDVMPEKNMDSSRMHAYLTKTKGLSEKVVAYFEQKGLIYEEAEHNNMVSLGRDPQGKVRNVTLDGEITGVIYRRMGMPGNNENYGLNIVNPDNNELKVFESVIDCMSYMDITGDYQSNKLVMGLFADNPLEQFLKDYSHIDKISFCSNSDTRMRKAIYGEQAGDAQPERKKSGLKEKYERKGYQVSAELVPKVRGKTEKEYPGHLKQNAASESREGQNVVMQKRRGR